MFLDLDKKTGTAVRDDDGAQLSYPELCSFAGTFHEFVGRRTLIFILSENNVGSLAAYVACLARRIVPLIISCNTDQELLQRLIQTYRPEYLWTPERIDNGTAAILYRQFGYKLWKAELKGFGLHDDLALLLSTSGSTGSPKLVRHSYDNVERNARNVATFFELTSDERPIAMLPMHYTMGLSVVTSHLYAGAMILLTKRSLTESQFWQLVKEERATSFTGVPYSFEVLQKLRFFRMDLPHLKLITQGGGKLKEELFKACAEYAINTNKKFIATYGQTEGTARMAYLPHQMAIHKIGSIGKAIPEGELFLVDDEGREVQGAEAVGQMVYRGPNVTLGYAYTGDDLCKGDENNGVLYTGDIARRDADGCYFIVGRVNRFLKIFGLRISLDELELLIRSSFDVDCVCKGDDDKMLVYITKEEHREAVNKFIVEKTGLYHKAFDVAVKDEIRRSESGKVIY